MVAAGHIESWRGAERLGEALPGERPFITVLLPRPLTLGFFPLQVADSSSPL